MCCPARGLEPPPSVLEPPESRPRRTVWIREVEKVFLSSASASFRCKGCARGGSPRGLSDGGRHFGCSGTLRPSWVWERSGPRGREALGLRAPANPQSTLQLQGWGDLLPGRYPAGSDKKCPGRRGWGEVHRSRAIAPVKAISSREPLALTLDCLTGLDRSPQGGRARLSERETGRTGETRGAREFRGLCSWIVRIAEASERCSVPEASG